jgi:predicted nucleotidyltransferase
MNKIVQNTVVANIEKHLRPKERFRRMVRKVIQSRREQAR